MIKSLAKIAGLSAVLVLPACMAERDLLSRAQELEDEVASRNPESFAQSTTTWGSATQPFQRDYHDYSLHVPTLFDSKYKGKGTHLVLYPNETLIIKQEGENQLGVGSTETKITAHHTSQRGEEYFHDGIEYTRQPNGQWRGKSFKNIKREELKSGNVTLREEVPNQERINRLTETIESIARKYSMY